MNEILDFTDVENTEFVLTGLCGSININQMSFEKSTNNENILFVNTNQDEPVYWENTGWISDNLRRIIVTGGTDVDNSDLIEWFIKNGRLTAV